MTSEATTKPNYKMTIAAKRLKQIPADKPHNRFLAMMTHAMQREDALRKQVGDANGNMTNKDFMQDKEMAASFHYANILLTKRDKNALQPDAVVHTAIHAQTTLRQHAETHSETHPFASAYFWHKLERLQPSAHPSPFAKKPKAESSLNMDTAQLCQDYTTCIDDIATPVTAMHVTLIRDLYADTDIPLSFRHH